MFSGFELYSCWVPLRNDVWVTRAEIQYRWRFTTPIWLMLLIRINQIFSQSEAQYLDSVAPSVWNFCSRFSDVISRENQPHWRLEISAFSQAIDLWILMRFILFCSPSALEFKYDLLDSVYLFTLFIEVSAFLGEFYDRCY